MATETKSKPEQKDSPSKILKELVKMNYELLSPYQKGVRKTLEESAREHVIGALNANKSPKEIEQMAGLDPVQTLSQAIESANKTDSPTGSPTGMPTNLPEDRGRGFLNKLLISVGAGMATAGGHSDIAKGLLDYVSSQNNKQNLDPMQQASLISSTNATLNTMGLGDYQAEGSAEGNTYIKAKSSSYATATSQEDINATVNGVAEGTVPPDLTKIGARRDITTLTGRLAKKGLDLKQLSLDYQAEQSFMKSLNSTQQVRLRQLIPSVQDGIKDLLELNTQFKRTGIKAFNKATMQYYLNGGGSKEQQSIAQKFNSQMTVLADEMGSIFMGGNTPTERSLDLAVKLFNGDYNDTAIEASMEQVKRNLGYRKNAIESVKAVGTKGTIGGNDIDLSSMSDDELRKIAGGK